MAATDHVLLQTRSPFNGRSRKFKKCWYIARVHHSVWPSLQKHLHRVLNLGCGDNFQTIMAVGSYENLSLAHSNCGSNWVIGLSLLICRMLSPWLCLQCIPLIFVAAVLIVFGRADLELLKTIDKSLYDQAKRSNTEPEAPLLVYPPGGGADTVSLHSSDLLLLEPTEWFNDSLIDFAVYYFREMLMLGVSGPLNRHRT